MYKNIEQDAVVADSAFLYDYFGAVQWRPLSTCICDKNIFYSDSEIKTQTPAPIQQFYLR